MDCVKCGAELTGSEAECPTCGVILSKARTTPPPRDPVARGDDAGARPTGGVYQYLVIPFRGNIRSAQKVEVVSAQLQDLINHYASYGWELVQVSDVSLTVDTGCLGAFLGRGSYQLSYDQVVFRQPI
jgi:hypothetical protein